MKKIMTVTLNPAVDKTYTTQELIVGNVNRMRTVMKIAGGKGVNVAKVLRQYDFDVAATGFLGGYSGRFIEEELERRGAACRFVHVDGETRSNMNILADNGFVTEILEPGPVISAQKQREFMEQYERLLGECGMVVLSGSVGQGMDADIYETLTARAEDAGVPVCLDASGESLRLGLRARPRMVKPNLRELEGLMGRKLRDRGQAAEAARLLCAEGIARVVVSMGSRGLLSVTADGVLYARALGIVPVNTVGCGDCVVASYAMSYMKGESEEEAVRRACAVSAANATTLESADIPMAAAEKLRQEIVVERMDGSV